MTPQIRDPLSLVRAACGAAPPAAVAEEDAGAALAEDMGGLQHALRVTAGMPSTAAQVAAHRQAAAGALVQLRYLQILLTELAVAGLEPVVLPGASLLRLYPDAGCRPMCDVDLLCPPGRGQELRDGLRRCGWEAAARHPGLWSRGGLTVDLHGDLFNSDRLPARRRAGWLEPRDVWQRRRRVEVQGIPILGLSSVDEVLYTAAHALRHSYRRLTWLVDLSLQLRDPGLVTADLRRAAAASGLGRPVIFGLSLLEQAAVPLSPALADWLRHEGPGPALQRVLRWIVASRQHTCAGEILWCWTCPAPRDRVRLLAQFVFPRTEVLLQVFPHVPRRLAPLAYALRCGQIARRGVAELAALAARPAGRMTRRGRG